MTIRLSVLVLLLSAVLMAVQGCSENNTVTPMPNNGFPPAQNSDAQALKTAVISTDSIAGYSTSDEVTIDDNGLQNPVFNGSATASVVTPPIVHIFGDSIYPIRWGRKIYWESITRNYDATTVGDSAGYVLITKTIPGEFLVAWGIRTADSVVIDTVVAKPFTETVQRKVTFKRIARSNNPMHNWIPTAITLVDGQSGGSSSSQIGSINITDGLHTLDTTITDPLNEWFRFGFIRGCIPVFPRGDSVIVHVTVTSSDSLPEIAYLRQGIAGGWPNRGRAMMTLDSTTGGPGAYTRVYSETFQTSMPRGFLAAQFNAIVDVFSNGTIYSMSAPFMNEFWGAPYSMGR